MSLFPFPCRPRKKQLFKMILTNRTFVAVHTGLIFVFQLLATLDKDKMLY